MNEQANNLIMNMDAAEDILPTERSIPEERQHRKERPPNPVKPARVRAHELSFYICWCGSWIHRLISSRIRRRRRNED